MTETFFTSDMHFGHKRIRELAGRPFDSDEDMAEAMIENWNARVGAGDIVYHLGDFSFLNATATAEIVARLQGNIHFLRGNHDEPLAKAFRGGLIGGRNPAYRQQRGAQRFLHDYKEIRMDGRKVVMFHFPIAVWNGAHNGAWHLHGHSHGNYPHNGQPLLDVGVDSDEVNAPPYSPIHWDEIVEVLQHRTYTASDHHGGLD